MTKITILSQLIAHLELKLGEAIHSAKQAHLDAINDQSKAETQYDTLAIESAYLAEGQSKRVSDYQQQLIYLKQAVHQVNGTPSNSSPQSTVNLGSLVLVEQHDVQQYFFILSVGAGFTSALDTLKVTVISPHSPIGQALLGAQVNDEVQVSLGGSSLSYCIVSVI